MTTTLNSNPAGRDLGFEVVQYVSGRLTLAGADGAVRIGRLPAGCVIIGIASRVITAFTGGTPVLGVGTASNLVGTNGNLQAAMAEAAGSELVFPTATVAQPLAADTDVWAGTTGGTTAGDGVVGVLFMKPLA